MPGRKALALVVSLDTKAPEAAYLRERVAEDGIEVVVVDFGTGPPGFTPHVPATTIAELGGGDLEDLRRDRDRAAAIDVMMSGVATWAARAYAAGDICGLVSIGGSGGTAVGTAAMRALPFGAPKIMISTVAASDVREYVGTKDVTMINSVVDFAGVNPISEPVLRNAAVAAGAMARAFEEPRSDQRSRLVAASQFGVTTAAIAQAQRLLQEAGFTLVPFHATGIGGRTMEDLIADGMFEAVLDLTTTEWADEVVGGTLSAGPTRLEAAGRIGIPQIVAPGALDMVNFFMAPVPERFATRTFHRHNANVTLMRTDVAENAEIGRRIAQKLNAAVGPVTMLFPLRGVSALDVEGGPFFDPQANASLLRALKTHLDPRIRLEELDLHINDPGFAAAAVEALFASLEHTESKSDA
ncbi:Tm-1-like ATP-binding domain-containing protein [Devosia nitrariae]|uniref:Uncharacterized protein n=1 Tax=Devosia nitrariae TaxID=2071872 RepID=A0ABQ5W845_9HYPH|nr:Tm-1-like ATP-binding domain-containing protein [Devosia nitrariae]GLQ56203.1 hypothetical protein GCM10010862_34620 [Devosia nitrariae]